MAASSGDWKSLPQSWNLPAQVECQSPQGDFADVAVTFSRWAGSYRGRTFIEIRVICGLFSK